MAAPLVPIVWSVARWTAISVAVYFAGSFLEETSENIQETINPTTPIPEGRTESTFTLPLSVGVMGVVLSSAYAFDKIVKPFLKKGRK